MMIAHLGVFIRILNFEISQFNVLLVRKYESNSISGDINQRG